MPLGPLSILTNMKQARPNAFTLIELLVVISIIALLTGILIPSLIAAKDAARSAQCLSNLHNLGVAMGLYTFDNQEYYWPYRLDNYPQAGTKCYFWGTDSDPVDTRPSPFMKYCKSGLKSFWCPSLEWGSYTTEGTYVKERTTTYGYNMKFLHNADMIVNKKPLAKRTGEIPKPIELFVFGDTAMVVKGVKGKQVFMNNTVMEPVEIDRGPNLPPLPTNLPTNHFRHRGRTNILTADGRASSFLSENGAVDAKTKLGVVGTQNAPHYSQ